jgi:hypothetical protein
VASYRDPATSGASQTLTDAARAADSSAAVTQPGLLTSRFGMYRLTVMADFGARIGMTGRYGIFAALLLLAFSPTIPHGFSLGYRLMRSAVGRRWPAGQSVVEIAGTLPNGVTCFQARPSAQPALEAADAGSPRQLRQQA